MHKKFQSPNTKSALYLKKKKKGWETKDLVDYNILLTQPNLQQNGLEY